MTEALTVAVPKELDLLNFMLDSRAQFDEVRRVDTDSVCVVKGRQHVFVRRDHHAECEYRDFPEDYVLMRGGCEAPDFYGLVYGGSVELAAEVLRTFIWDSRVMVDTHHGLVVPGPRFAEVLRDEHPWWVSDEG